MDSSTQNAKDTQGDKEAANNEGEHSVTGKRKIVHAEGGPIQQKKIMSTRSPVWDYFTKLKEDQNICSCHYCKKTFGCSSKSGTSHLSNHLKVCKSFIAWKEGQSKAQAQTVINDQGNFKSAKVSETVFREATNELMVLAELPLAFVEGMAYKHYCNKLNLYKPVSRRTATRDIVEIFVKKRENLKNWFLTTKQRVSLTTDIWVCQPTGASYMVITGHFIDENWKLKKLILGFKYITYHKGQTISTILLECLAEWGIEKIFCVIVDNATANSTALRSFQNSFSLECAEAFVLDGEFLHVRCAAHILNLIVKEGMAEIDDSVCAIRNAVCYVRSHTNRTKAFELRVDLGRLQEGSLPLDVKKRWNSTYTLLKKAIVYKSAFDKMMVEDKLYGDYFLEYDKEKKAKRIGPPSMSDWRAVEKLLKFLAIFYNATLTVSASTTLNAHKCYGEIVIVANSLRTLGNSLYLELKTKAEEMLTKFKKYWDGLKNINKLLIVATVFDPTKKLNFAKMCFNILYGKDSLQGKELYDSTFWVLEGLFKEYNSRYNKVETGQSSQSTQPSSINTQDQRVELLDEDIGFERMDSLYREMVGEVGVQDQRTELERYLKEPVENPNTYPGTEYNVLSYWKQNSAKYTVLAAIARDVLAMQVSSVASESAFSTSGRIVEPHRSCLTHYMVEILMCTEQWMKQDSSITDPISLTTQELYEDVAMQDKIERELDSTRTGED